MQGSCLSSVNKLLTIFPEIWLSCAFVSFVRECDVALFHSIRSVTSLLCARGGGLFHVNTYLISKGWSLAVQKIKFST